MTIEYTAHNQGRACRQEETASGERDQCENRGDGAPNSQEVENKPGVAAEHVIRLAAVSEEELKLRRLLPAHRPHHVLCEANGCRVRLGVGAEDESEVDVKHIYGVVGERERSEQAKRVSEASGERTRAGPQQF